MTQLVEEHKFCPKKKLHRRKKREIRVFVSSTFKDFTKEREEIIKKAFREASVILLMMISLQNYLSFTFGPLIYYHVY